MDCAADCSGELNIAPQLRTLSAGQWHNLSVELACFEGVDFGQVFTPFSLATDGPLTLSFSDIRLLPDTAEATVRCQAD